MIEKYKEALYFETDKEEIMDELQNSINRFYQENGRDPDYIFVRPKIWYQIDYELQKRRTYSGPNNIEKTWKMVFMGFKGPIEIKVLNEHMILT